MAVAYDDSTVYSDSSGAGGDITFAHTCTGDNRALLLFVGIDDFDDIVTPTATYNGTSMTEVFRQNKSIDVISLVGFSLLNPDTGSNNIFIDYGVGVRTWDWAIAVSYIGVSSVGVDNTASGSSNTPSVSLTTTQDNSMIVVSNHAYGGDTDPFTPANGETEREDGATGTALSTDGSYWLAELLKATAGSQTLGGTMTADDGWAIGAVELIAFIPPQTVTVGDGIVSAETFGTASFTYEQEVSPTSIASVEEFGTLTRVPRLAVSTAYSQITKNTTRYGN